MHKYEYIVNAKNLKNKIDIPTSMLWINFEYGYYY